MRKWITVLGFVGILEILGCGYESVPGTVTKPAPDAKGARLRIVSVTTQDGQRITMPYLWDTRMQEFCTFNTPSPSGLVICQSYEGITEGRPQSAYVNLKIDIEN